MNLIILDLVRADLSKIDISIFRKKDIKILALTPLSFFYLEENEIDFISFHTIISQEQFREEVLKLYKKLFLERSFFSGIYREISQYLNIFLYREYIKGLIDSKNYNDIIYITDRKIDKKLELSNNCSFLYSQLNLNSVNSISQRDLNIKLYNRYRFTTNIFKKIKNRILKRNLKYDWIDILDKFPIKNNKIDLKIVDFSYKIDNFNFNLNFSIEKENYINNYNTFLTKNNFFHVKEYKKNNKLYFFQHGSYLYKNLFIKYGEIELADINFVFNDYTKKVFKDLGAKKVYSVGSIVFNKKIKERKKEYDFLYIIQGHDYMGNLQYVDFSNSLHSFDGYELYQRHKGIIKLFGEKFKSKKIIIRVHPLVLTSGLYVPFWELAKPYSNIVIDVSIPIHTLIEKSKYIISDYFTTEFINREIHYKRDIILFKGVPTPLPKETMEDMKKMFILVDTVEDLEEKVKNIEEITKNRIRYDDIIEYYSSKKCYTKYVVNEILDKEL